MINLRNKALEKAFGDIFTVKTRKYYDESEIIFTNTNKFLLNTYHYIYYCTSYFEGEYTEPLQTVKTMHNYYSSLLTDAIGSIVSDGDGCHYYNISGKMFKLNVAYQDFIDHAMILDAKEEDSDNEWIIRGFENEFTMLNNSPYFYDIIQVDRNTVVTNKHTGNKIKIYSKFLENIKNQSN